MRVHGYLSGNPVHDRVVRAFMAGVPEEHQCLLIDNWEYKDPDVVVVFGVYKRKVPISWPRGGVLKKHWSKTAVILETGYVERGDGEDNYYAAGLNGLNNRADFRNKDMPGDRAKDIELHDWKKGDHVLLCGQIPWDASCQHVDLPQWLKHMASKIRDHTTRPIMYREHPLMKGTIDVGADYVSQADLKTDLLNAHCVVTFNSNTSVDAILAGVPAFVFDEGAMSWDVANHTLEKMPVPNTPDRQQWLNNLMYTQWRPNEMSEGKAWRHLFR